MNTGHLPAAVDDTVRWNPAWDEATNPMPVELDSDPPRLVDRVRPRRIAVAAAVLMLVGGAAIAVKVLASSNAPDCTTGPGTRWVADVDGDGCDDIIEWDTGRTLVTVTTDGQPSSFQFANLGEATAEVGDWNCDGISTLAFSTADGRRLEFDAWPTGGERATATPRVSELLCE